MAFRVSSGPDGTEAGSDAPPKRGPGRPRKPDARRRLLTLRHTEEQHQDLLDRAEAAGLTPEQLAVSLVWPSE